MSNPIPVNIISDDDTTPLQFKSKKQRISFDSNATTVFIIDDDPTPRKPSPSPSAASTPSVVPETPSVAPETPSVVPETPMVESPQSYVPIVRGNNAVSDPQPRFSSSPNPKPSGLICLESDEECEGFGSFPEKLNESTSLTLEVENNLEIPSTCSKSFMLQDSSCLSPMLEELPKVSDHSGEEDDIEDPTSEAKGKYVNKKWSEGKTSEEEKDHLMNEKKPQKEESFKAYVPLVRCNNSMSSSNPKPSGLICLESDDESEGFENFPEKLKESTSLPCSKSSILQDNSCFPYMLEDEPPQVSCFSGEDDIENSTIKNISPKGKKTKGNNVNKKRSNGGVTKEEKARLMNEKKQQKEQEKLQKLALKAQAAEMKKMQKDIQNYEKGKFAQKSIVAQIDTKVIEQGSIGGQLLTRFAEKGIQYRITSNAVEKSIIWNMSVPQHITHALTRGTEIPYVLVIFEAEEFCKLVMDDETSSFMDHVTRVQSMYPSHTICYLTNRLTSYINKREQEHYKNPGNHSGWRRPPVEQMLSNLTTHFVGVHSRLCTDESELAEHVVGLTSSLASCQFRKKLTRLSVNANNGTLIPKDADRFLIKKNIWLKALIAIPKVQPRAAIAIWKKYPTMKSLLTVYMDPTKSEHEKEFLLENLKTEGVVGDNRRLGEICSKRIYRILMAERGTTKTDDVENGADFFSPQSSQKVKSMF
ncbi:crossover junction endonuclease EME1B isoform X2 [Lactuca sativa]|uniref:crossover junction endonuclease EME1B isoform X2 n=1 Tax=Lactuca sativa TaxID=4236 RepID=UPI000CD969F5|nr:crossover junction endonuclease EME1B isoform X2 [Lactuca sativa]